MYKICVKSISIECSDGPSLTNTCVACVEGIIGDGVRLKPNLSANKFVSLFHKKDKSPAGGLNVQVSIRHW